MSSEQRVHVETMSEEDRTPYKRHQPYQQSPQSPMLDHLSVPDTRHHPLHLPVSDFRFLFDRFGPSLGLWRAGEIAALREVVFERPILDLGCGDGLVTSMVLDRVDLGLDPERPALDSARSLNVYEQLEPLHVEDAGLTGASFRTVLSNSVLEHVPNINAVLAEIARVLRPGGRLVYTSPTSSFTGWLALPSARYGAWRNHHLGHLNLWTTDEWAARLVHAGLEVETARHYLRRSLVTTWDVLELLQQIWFRQRRLFSVIWTRIPSSGIALLARRAALLDLSSPPPGGGQLIVARKRA